MMDIKKELENNNSILLYMPNNAYSESLIKIVKQLSNPGGLYVTLNNPYTTLAKKFRGEGINPDKFFFIDAISSSVKLESTTENCIFVSGPTALTQLSIAIITFVEKQKPPIIIFDSLSSLIIYLPVKSVIGFTQSMATKFKEHDVKAIFPIIKNEELVKNISMFIDKVIDLNE